MNEILEKLGSIDERLNRIESKLGAGTLVQSRPTEAPVVNFVPPQIPVPPAPTPPAPKPGPVAITRPIITLKKPVQNLESKIGQWWLGIGGAVITLIGASFFLTKIFAGLGDWGKVLVAIVTGILALGAGEFLRSKFAKFSYILSGTGLGLLYLAVYVSANTYHLIPQSIAFVLMIVVTAFGVALSIWADAFALSMLTALGAFMTPFLVGDSNQGLVFFSYIGLINLGILVVSVMKKWQPLMFLGFIGTIVSVSSWYGGHYTQDKLWGVLIAISFYFLTYLTASFLSNIFSKEKCDQVDLLLLTLNPAWFFAWAYYLLNAEYRHLLGFFAFALALLYGTLLYYLIETKSKDVMLRFALGGMSFLFLSTAIPLELDGSAVTVAWAIETLVLFTIGGRVGTRKFNIPALIIFCLALFNFIFYGPAVGGPGSFLPVFNARFLIYLMFVAVSIATVISLRRYTVSSLYRSCSTLTLSFTPLWVLEGGTITAGTFRFQFSGRCTRYS